MKRLSKWWIWMVALLAGLVILAVPLPVASAAPVERTFRIEASRFQYSPAVLKVNPGDRVTLEVDAMDVVHGLSIDGYNLQTVANPGQTARLTFVANKTGSFHFRCTVTCGNLHPFMLGKLQVGSNILLWKAIGLALIAFISGVGSLWK